jgi:hypothetical protein
VDPGRIWIAVAPSMSQGPTSRLSNALSGYLNADGGGTVVVVAGGSVWGSTSWEDGKDEYAKALDCYQQADRRLEQSGDEYQFERATAAVREGLEHVTAAERLLNQTRA